MSARDETRKHIEVVRSLIFVIQTHLIQRGADHDKSKLDSPEVEMFDEFTAKLRGLTYGSDEYKKCLKDMGPALQHHYENNRHHPEHHDRGVDGMTIVDLVEMICDWKAATLRHENGDIMKSIEINSTRFNLSPQLASILRNTIIELGWEKRE